MHIDGGAARRVARGPGPRKNRQRRARERMSLTHQIDMWDDDDENVIEHLLAWRNSR